MDQNRKSVGGTRSVTRLYAVQMLYCTGASNRSLDQLLSSAIISPKVFIDEESVLTKVDCSFLKKLLITYETNSAQIAQTISKYLPESWQLDRLDPVMYAILGLGTTEILYFPKIAHTIILNEYIELAKAFFDKPEASFVNGILSAISTNSNQQQNN